MAQNSSMATEGWRQAEAARADAEERARVAVEAQEIAERERREAESRESEANEGWRQAEAARADAEERVRVAVEAQEIAERERREAVSALQQTEIREAIDKALDVR